MKILAILLVLTAVSITTESVQAHAEEELAKLNMAASNPNPRNHVEMEEVRRMRERTAIMKNFMSPKQMAEYRNLVAKAKSSIRKSASARANMQYTAQKTQKVYTYPKEQVFDSLQKQAKKVDSTMAVGAVVDKQDMKVDDPVLVDTEAIIQHAKMAAERAKKLPRSFKEWEQRIQRKMATSKAQKRITGQAVATKYGVQNSGEIRVAKSRIDPYMRPSSEMLSNEMNSGMNQGKIAAARKTQWESTMPARIEASLRKTQQQWEEEMKNMRGARMFRA